jgi:hypothetical protein
MTTTHLGLPELKPSQSQKHVTHNEALEHLDVVVQLAVLDKDLSTPPGSPTTGDRYIVGASATDDWTGKEDEIAYYDGDGWIFKTPNDGWFCWVDDESEIYFYNAGWSALGDVLGADYMPLAGGTFTGDVDITTATSPTMGVKTTANSNHTADLYLQGARTGASDSVGEVTIANNLSGGIETLFTLKAFQDYEVEYNVGDASGAHLFQVGGSTEVTISQYGMGVGSTADATNGFAFYGTNLLLNSGGSIDLKYNKNASGDDASITFQQGFSTYALMGLLANNDWTLKVGTGFTTAIVAAESDGDVTFPNQRTVRALMPFGGRYYLYTDNRWIGPNVYQGLENKAVNLGTGATPNVDWEAMGDLFLQSGTVIKDVKMAWRVNNSEVTSLSWKLYFQYNAWDGNADTTGEITRVELSGGTFTPAGAATALNNEDLGITEYTCPDDGFLLLCVKPSGTITATRYFYVAGHADLLLQE